MQTEQNSMKTVNFFSDSMEVHGKTPYNSMKKFHGKKLYEIPWEEKPPWNSMEFPGIP